MKASKPIPGMEGKSKKKDLFLIDETENKSVVHSLWPLYAIIPSDLLRDNSITPIARLVYGIYHSYCKNKYVTKGSSTFVSQPRVAKDLGRSQSTVSKATNELKDNNWLSIIRRGQGKPNIIVLHDRQRRLSKSQLGQIKKEVGSYSYMNN